MESTGKKDESKQEKKWTQIAEVRMLMYVVPAAIALAIIGMVLSQCSYR